MKKLLKNTSLQALAASFVAYVLAKTLGDVSWVSGGDAPGFYSVILLVKDSFLSVLRMLIAPLIFFSLLGGLFNIGEIAKLRSIGKVAVIYYLGTTLIAVLIGLAVVFFIHPWEGSGVRINVASVSSGADFSYVAPKKLIEEDSTGIISIFSRILDKALVNPFEALSTNNILGIVFAALLLGLAAVFSLPPGNMLSRLTDEINKVLHQVLSVVIRFLPIGIFAIVFDLSLKITGNIFGQLLSFCLVVFGATMVHGLIVLPLIAMWRTKIGYFELFRNIGKPMIVAFSTSSSSATLPVSMETAERELGVSKSVSGFVFPLGATMNMDGTALFEGVAAVFLAYLFGIDLSTGGMLSIFFMAMISSVGAPGMPSGSMSAMQMVLLAAGIPLEAIGILLVVERPLDTFRTAVNVEGDIIGAAVVQSYLDQKNA